MPTNVSSTHSVLTGSIARFTILAAASVLLPAATHGQSSSWTSTATGTWSNTANWLGGIVADGAANAADFSTIDLTTDIAIHLDTPRTIGSLIFGDTDIASAGGWLLDDNGAPANVLTLQGSTPNITVNDLGTGKFATISAGIAGVELTKAGAGNLVLSGTNTYTGNLNVNSGGVTLTGSNQTAQALFMRGVSSLTIDSGGSLRTTNNFSSIGQAAGDVATVTVKGTGSFVAGDADFNVSDVDGSQGALSVQDSATLSVAGTFFVAKNPNTTASLSVSGGTVTASKALVIGRNNNANGTLTVSGGALSVGGNFVLGENAGSNGDATLTGGSLAVNGETWVGNNGGGNGHFTQSAGTVSGNSWFVVGRFGATGVYDMTGGTLTKTGGGDFLLGDGGGSVGTMNVAGSSSVAVNNGNLVVGNGGGSNGTLSLSGASTVSVNNELWVGQGGVGTGTLNVTGSSSLSTGNWLAVGRQGGIGTVNLSGGTITKGGTNGSHFIVGSLGGTGTINQTGGAVAVTAGDIRLGEGTSTALWDLSGGTVTADRILIGFEGGTNEFRIRDNGSITTTALDLGRKGTAIINQTGGTVTVTGNLDLKFEGTPVDPTFTGTGTYNLSGGSLSVNGVIDGTIGAFNFTGGEITRSTPGPIVFNGDLTTGTGLATFDLDSDKTFDINGAFNKVNGLTLELTGVVIPAWDGVGIDTGSISLGSVNSIVGTFGPATDTITGLAINNPFPTAFISEADGELATFNASSQSVYWIQENGGNVTLQYSVVPEPGSAVLLALGGLAFGLRRRRS